jgi:hypothetical protein
MQISKRRRLFLCVLNDRNLIDSKMTNAVCVIFSSLCVFVPLCLNGLDAEDGLQECRLQIFG